MSALRTLVLTSVTTLPISLASPAIAQPVSREAVVSVLTDNYATVAQWEPDSLPRDLAELYILRMLQPQLNRDAGPQYLKSILFIPQEGKDLDSLRVKPLAERLAALKSGTLRDQLSGWNGAQSFIRSALVSNSCNLHPNTEYGIATLLPELGKFREVARWQLASGDAALAEGKPWLALMRYRETVEIGRDIGGGGEYLIGTLVGVAIQAEAWKHLREAIPALIEAGIEPARLRTIVQCSPREDYDMVEALSGERLWLLNEPMGLATLLSDSTDSFWLAALRFSSLMGVDTTGLKTAEDMRRKAAEVGAFGLSEKQLRDPDAILAAISAAMPEYLHLIDRTVTLSEVEPSRFGAAVAAFQSEVDAVGARNSIVKAMYPSLPRALTNARRLTRDRQTTMWLCAAIEWRAANQGTWPASIEQLSGSNPELAWTDPVQGKPYTLTSSGSTVTIGWTKLGDETADSVSITLSK